MKRLLDMTEEEATRMLADDTEKRIAYIRAALEAKHTQDAVVENLCAKGDMWVAKMRASLTRH